jgi:hypothetical protein
MRSGCEHTSQCIMIVIAMVMTTSVTWASPTPNGSSFLDAKESQVDYTSPKVKHPRTSCRSLIGLSDSHNSVLSATLILANAGSPEMCEVRGVLNPEVQYIVNLPTEWNARLYMHGNGGWAGESLDDEAGQLARLKAVQHGFATAFTNTGHDAKSEPGTDWGYNNVQKEIDWGFRAVHVTALAVKELAAQYYGKSPAYSYFDGCSTGGLQGFTEAQRFPDDFDGILAGAPVFSLNEMIWQYWKNHKAIDETPLSREKLKLLGDIILKSFDAVDGVKDGVIGNPLTVDFDPERDLPRATAVTPGFTDDEIRMLDIIYGPTYVGDTKIYPRLTVGGEFPGRTYLEGTYKPNKSKSSWEGRVVPDSQGGLGQPFILQTWFQNLAFEVDDSELDWKALNPEQDMLRTVQSSRIFNATDPDLKSFHLGGGKMIIYHGWADFGINPLRTVEYFEQVAAVSGDEIDDFLQLYLIPGMDHCTGGVNIDRFDLMTPLINWVEDGVLPHDLVGLRIDEGKVTRTRPLCAYPQVSRYRGTGDIDAQESFDCVDPEL